MMLGDCPCDKSVLTVRHSTAKLKERGAAAVDAEFVQPARANTKPLGGIADVQKYDGDGWVHWCLVVFAPNSADDRDTYE